MNIEQTKTDTNYKPPAKSFYKSSDVQFLRARLLHAKRHRNECKHR